MIKKCICILSVLLTLGVFCTGMSVFAEEAVTGNKQKYGYLGYNVKDTTEWEGLKGTLEIMPLSSTSIVADPELYVAQLYYAAVDPETLSTLDQDAFDELFIVSPGLIFTIRGNKEQLVETLIGLRFADQSDRESVADNLIQIGEADDYQFYAYIDLNEEYADSLEEEYKEDYNHLSDLILKELGDAEYYAPIDPLKATEGQKLSFTTTDLDGNTVTSEELFGENEITMVNLWGIWCINCVNEMEELAEIHTRLQEKGCGIVGLEWEQNPGEETYQQARDLMLEKGTNYPSVLMPTDNEILNTVTGFPTTFYVDKEGIILTYPVVGAQVNKYEPVLEKLLESSSIMKEETEEAEEEAEEKAAEEEETAEEKAEVPADEATDAGCIYRVFVKDEEGNPLKEAVVQFCDDTFCTMGETDENGCAVFEVSEEKSYEVHILTAPEGYVFDEEVVYTDETASDTTLVLKKE